MANAPEGTQDADRNSVLRETIMPNPPNPQPKPEPPPAPITPADEPEPIPGDPQPSPDQQIHDPPVYPQKDGPSGVVFDEEEVAK
jgi:hypothetical protein